MPNYSYRCSKDASTMVLQRAIDERDNEVLCSLCNEPMIRYYDAPAIQFKGSGFYKTGG